jgi:DNA-binding transcriptional LysR family regulator
LRYFVAVAEELSFTRAAERLYVSQPALSKQVRQLENTLGTELLARDRRHVSLTAAGRALLSHAREVLGHWDDTVADLERIAGQERAVLRVGMLTSLGRDLYPAVLRRFEYELPGWNVRLRTHTWGDPTAGLADGSADVAFVWLPVDDPRIDLAVLFSEARWVALSAHHRLANQTEIDFAELEAEPFIALPASAGSLRDFWLATDARTSSQPLIAAEAAAPDEKFEMIASGLAVCLLAQGNVDLYARQGVACRPVRGLAPCHLAVAWRRGDRRPSVRAFVSACRASVAPLETVRWS